MRVREGAFVFLGAAVVFLGAGAFLAAVADAGALARLDFAAGGGRGGRAGCLSASTVMVSSSLASMSIGSSSLSSSSMTGSTTTGSFSTGSSMAISSSTSMVLEVDAMGEEGFLAGDGIERARGDWIGGAARGDEGILGAAGGTRTRDSTSSGWLLAMGDPNVTSARRDRAGVLVLAMGNRVDARRGVPAPSPPTLDRPILFRFSLSAFLARARRGVDSSSLEDPSAGFTLARGAAAGVLRGDDKPWSSRVDRRGSARGAEARMEAVDSRLLEASLGV